MSRSHASRYQHFYLGSRHIGGFKASGLGGTPVRQLWGTGMSLSTLNFRWANIPKPQAKGRGGLCALVPDEVFADLADDRQVRSLSAAAPNPLDSWGACTRTPC